jgi:hypothetical protein
VGGDDLQLARKQPAMNDSSWPNTALSAVRFNAARLERQLQSADIMRRIGFGRP